MAGTGLAAAEPVVGYMLDVSRNKVPTMPTMRRIVDIVSGLGYDQLQLYFEHAFAYKGHEAVWRDVTPFTPDEIRELDAYCAAHGMELVPNQNSFGHLECWFEHHEYRPLAELPEGGVKIPWGGRTHEPRALCATSQASFDFLDGLYRQLLPCFKSRYLNVGCDEVMDICDPVGRSAAEIRSKGEPRVYLEYLKKLHDLVSRHGHVMMYWADGVINRDAKFLAEVPKDAIAMEWAYEYINNIDAGLRRLAAAGIPFYVCPGSSNWLSLSGRYENMKSNVTACVNLGRKHGAKGYLMTDWGDGGHCRPWITALPALIQMKERTAGRDPSDSDVAAQIDAITGARCGEALIRYQKLDLLSGIPWRYNYSETYNMLSDGEDYFRPAALTDENLKALFAEWRAAKATLDLARAPDWVRDGFALLDLMYEALELRWQGRHLDVAGKVPRYRELWLKYNRPGGLEKSIAKNFGRGTGRGFETPQLPERYADGPREALSEWRLGTADAEAVRRNVRSGPDTPRARWRDAGALELPVSFRSDSAGALSWTVACDEILSCEALEFDFCCEETNVVSNVELAAVSGDKVLRTWPLVPKAEDKWCRMRVSCSGIGRIGGVRLSCSRGSGGGTALGLANLVRVLPAAGSSSRRYEATWESLDRRPVPQWWRDAKFGIFVHWGPYSVPAFAPTGAESVYDCYSEWYHGRLIKTNKHFVAHHRRHYGSAPYGNFAAQFKAENFKAEEWAHLFKAAGARYAVLTSKHHDGYALWPSPESPYYNSAVVGPGRDIAGEFTSAMKNAGLRSGFYFSLLEYANPLYPGNFLNRPDVRPMSMEEWSRRVNLPQMKELVENYKADIVWVDGEWDHSDKEELSEEFLAWLYNESSMRDSVVVNDRWGRDCRGRHGGHYTTEYAMDGGDTSGLSDVHPWEECRGIGRSFGYNRFETEADYMSREKCIETLVAVVAGGGNLLLNVGPTADGRIPTIMQDRLLAMGRWLEVNGEAIYGSSRWPGAGKSSASKRVYFTQKGGKVYVIVFGAGEKSVLVPGIRNARRVALLGTNRKVGWKAAEGGLSVEIPQFAIGEAPCEHAMVFVVEP